MDRVPPDSIVGIVSTAQNKPLFRFALTQLSRSLEKINLELTVNVDRRQ